MNKKARSRKFTAKQSARLGAYFATGVAASVAAPSEAEAAIVYFDVNPDRVLVGSSFGYATFGSINLGTATYTSGSTAGDYFSIGMDFGGDLFSGHYQGNVQWGLSGVNYGGFQPTRVQKMAYGTSISSISPSIGSWVNYGPYMSYNGTGPWAGGGNAYAPLRINAGGGDYNYGWVNINFVDNGNGTSTSTITGFAFEDVVNTAILAGDQGGAPAAVPEPGQVAASLLLLTGVAGYFAYRRRVGAATEPKALHDLALGARGIAGFRGDKAA